MKISKIQSEKGININSVYNFLYIVLIYLVCILPSTAVYFKLFIIILMVLGIFVLKKINIKLILPLIFLMTILLITFFQGLQNGFNHYSKQEFFGYMGAIILGLLAFIVTSPKTILLKHLYFATGIYSAGKVLLCILIMTNIVNVYDLIDMIINIFDYKIVTFLINEKLNLYRIYLINDLMLLIVPYLYFWLKENSKTSKLQILILFLSCIGIILSYSRALMVAYFILLVISTLLVSSKKIMSILQMILLLLIILLINNFLNIADSFMERFNNSSAMNNFSDGVRDLQKRALISEIKKHIMVGIGLGGYSLEYPGIKNFPYSYENQWYATFMKFGFVKFIAFFGGLIFSLIILIKENKIALIHLIVFFYLPFTNPYLTSIQMSLIITVLILSNMGRK
ncbi:O-antigen ligase family protein [[Brevibacterium] frigoritolerans]|nr:O-antigen ligase family protein [Peribacillus frigoritolerans]